MLNVGNLSHYVITSIVRVRSPGISGSAGQWLVCLYLSYIIFSFLYKGIHSSTVYMI